MSLIVLWFAIVLTGLWWLIDARLVWFDSHGRLQQQVTDTNFEQRLARQVSAGVGDLTSAVVHVASNSCRCNWRTRGHQQAIVREVDALGGRNISIDIDQYPGLQRLIPATPAVIIFDQNSQLVYLGPYADGAFCSSATSFVEELIPAVRATERPRNSGWINMVAKGCYCDVAI